MNTLTINSNAIILPSQLFWVDEFENDPVVAEYQYSITGALIIQEGVKLAGIPIMLSTSLDGDWIDRNTLNTLYSNLAAGVMTLTLNDGRTFQVKWDHAKKAIDSTPVENHATSKFFTVTLRFLTL